MENKEKSLKNTARLAGFLYFLMALGAFGIIYVPSQLVVQDDAVKTAKNIIDNEFLLRLGIFSNFFCQTVFVFLALTLYKLFENVSKHLSRTLLALVIVAVPIAYFIAFNQLYALFSMKESFMTAFEPTQQQAIATSFLTKYNYGISIIGIFWGLWLIPFGQLVVKSGFIPKLLGYFLITGGISYLVDTTAFILLPDFHSFTNILTGIFSGIAEISMVLWLLIKGVNYKTDGQKHSH